MTKRDTGWRRNICSACSTAICPAEKLLHYREYDQGLPGHPEKLLTPGVEFSSGRLGHMWAFCNGVSMANPR